MLAQCDNGMLEKYKIFNAFMGPFKRGPMGPKGLKGQGQSRSFNDRSIIFGKWAQCDKVKQKKILFLNISIFDELGGLLKMANGAQKAKIHNFGYRNVIFGRQA